MRIQCEQCKKLFETRKRGNRITRFCSLKCYGKSKKGISSWNKGIPMADKTKEIQRQQRLGKHLSLKTEFQEGQKPWNYKGQYISTQGYVMVLKPDHHLANCRGYVPEQYLVAEKMLGRSLLKGEIVHHLNEVTTDNRPENLFVFPTRGEHQKFHNKLRWLKKYPFSIEIKKS
jgi:hypothetical protein